MSDRNALSNAENNDETKQGLVEKVRHWLKGRRESKRRKKSVFEQGLFKKILLGVPGGRVSKLHLQEAKERFITLYRMVHFYSQYYGCDEVTQRIEEHSTSAHTIGPSSELTPTVSGPSPDSESDKPAPKKGKPSQGGSARKVSKCSHLMTCFDILDKIEEYYLSRKEEQLGFAWRELTRVRITLTDHILPPEKLAEQIDACREEANRLAVLNDQDINVMMQKLAEALDEPNKNKKSEVQIRRQLKALLERFNTIRTGRIRQQYLNVRAYTWAVAVLILLSIILINNSDLILCNGEGSIKNDQGLCQRVEASVDGGLTRLGSEKVTAAPAPAPATDTATEGLEAVGGLMWHNTGDVIVRIWKKFDDELGRNVLLFVYLAGLTGGFFSVAARARNRESAQGDDAYVLRYVLTKPFVGALGAIILFILFQGKIIQSDLMVDIGSTPSPKVFGFAFLSGFTERIVFPEFK